METIYSAKETELIKGCKQHQRKAQREVYDRYSARMYGICYRYVKDTMVAEDIMVGTFTKVFERIGQFKEEGSFEGWIRRIAVNESLTYLRRNKALYLETDLEVVTGSPDYQALDSALQEEDLLTIIQELPTGYKMVFNMYAIDGYSHKEIAEQLGITEATSKSQLSRARVHLQKLLVAYGHSTIKTISHEPTT